MLWYPDLYLKNVEQITSEIIKKNGIKAIILDVDNTLIDYDKRMAIGIKKWCEDLKREGIAFYILSNSNHEEKVKKVAEELQVPYSFFAMKPLKKGMKKAIKYLQEKPENIAEVGDQIFTDVIGAKRCKLFSILVEPIDKKDIVITKWKRPIEDFIIRKYEKTLTATQKTKEEK